MSGLRIINQDVGMTNGHKGGRHLSCCVLVEHFDIARKLEFTFLGKPGPAFVRKLHGCPNLALICHNVVDVALV